MDPVRCSVYAHVTDTLKLYASCRTRGLELTPTRGREGLSYDKETAVNLLLLSCKPVVFETHAAALWLWQK